MNQTKANGKALIPFIVFIALYLGIGIYLESIGTEMAFYQFPSPVAIIVSIILAFIMFKEVWMRNFHIL